MKHRNFFSAIPGLTRVLAPVVRMKIFSAVAVIAVTVSISSAHSLPWSWDMWSQDAIQPYEEPVIYPRDSISTDGEKTRLENREEVELIEEGPVPATAESVSRGEKLFAQHCAVCHGPMGAGDGIIIKKGLGFYPVNLTTAAVKQRTDGYLYAYIRYGGKVMMPAYGESIFEEDSWNVVNYIRELQNGNAAKENR